MLRWLFPRPASDLHRCRLPKPLDRAPNKTDANDAGGLVHLVEVGFFRAGERIRQYADPTLVAARRSG